MNNDETNLTTVEYLAEDIESAALSLGLERIPAWVAKKPEKAGAKRSKRAREKAATLGVKQLSVSLPEAIHPLVKQMAVRLKEGEPIESAAAELMPGIRSSLSAIPFWRRLLLRWLLPAAVWNYHST